MRLLFVFIVLVLGVLQPVTCSSGPACVDSAGEGYCSVKSVHECETDETLHVVCRKTCDWCYGALDVDRDCGIFDSGKNLHLCNDPFFGERCFNSCKTFQGCADDLGASCSDRTGCSNTRFRTECRETCGQCKKGCYDYPIDAAYCSFDEVECERNRLYQINCPYTCKRCPQHCYNAVGQYDHCKNNKRLCATNATLRKICRKTCGLCHPPRCEDEFDECSHYTQQLCSDPTRKDFCQKSCGRCRKGSTGCGRNVQCLGNLECQNGVCACPKDKPIYDNKAMTCKTALVVGTEVPVVVVPVKDVPVKDVPVKDVPVKELPAKSAPVKDVPEQAVRNVDGSLDLQGDE